MQADMVHVFMFSSQVQRFVVGKSATQDITLTLYVLLREYIAGLFIPQVLVNMYSNIYIYIYI